MNDVVVSLGSWLLDWLYAFVPGKRFALALLIILLLFMLQWSFVHREKIELSGGVPGAVDNALVYQLSHKRTHQLILNPLPPGVSVLWDGFVTCCGTEKQRRTIPKGYESRATRFIRGRPLARVRLILVDNGKTWLCQRTTHTFDGRCLTAPSPRTPLSGPDSQAWETWYTAEHVGRSYFPPPGRDPGVWKRSKPGSAYKRCKPFIVARHPCYPNEDAKHR